MPLRRDLAAAAARFELQLHHPAGCAPLPSPHGSVALFGAGAARIRADVALTWKRPRRHRPCMEAAVLSCCPPPHFVSMRRQPPSGSPVEHLAGVRTDLVFAGRRPKTHYIWGHLFLPRPLPPARGFVFFLSPKRPPSSSSLRSLVVLPPLPIMDNPPPYLDHLLAEDFAMPCIPRVFCSVCATLICLECCPDHTAVHHPGTNAVLVEVVMVEGFPALTHRSVRTTGMGYDWNHIQRVKYDGNTWVMLRRDRPKKSMCGMHEKCPCGCRISPKNTFCSPSCKVAAIQRGRSWQLEGFPFIPDPDEQLPEVICARVTRVIVGDGRSAIPLRSQVLPSANNAHNCTCIMGEWCSVFCKRNGALGLLGCCPRLETVAQVGRSDRRRPKSNA
uniref:Uncharacterized protein n=1 Tax=Oryza glumipatula TaxID=40148 RepID=A0A0E0B846_9ORYZ